MRTLAIVTAFAFWGGCSRGNAEVTIFAASSLEEFAAGAARSWRAKTGETAAVSTGASSMLARQLQKGARADLFLSADPRWAEAVPARARRPLLGNRLVVVAPQGSTGPALERTPALVLAAAEVPAGRYAREALAALKVPMPARIVEGANVRDVLAKVAHGAAPLGIVYATDAALDPRVTVTRTLPPGSHSPIVYAAAALTPAGERFLEFLGSPEMREAAAGLGFEALK